MKGAQAVGFVARILLGAVFLISSSAKMLGPDPLLRVLSALGIGDAGRVGIAVLLLVVEIILGVCLVIGFGLKCTAELSVILLLSMTGVVGLAMARGISGDCRCFGEALPSGLGWTTIVRNLGLVGVALLVEKLKTHSFAVDNILQHRT